MKFSKIIIGLLLAMLALSAAAQTKRKTTGKKPSKKAVSVKKTVEEVEAATAAKKNARPDDEAQPTAVEKPIENVKTNARPLPAPAADKPVYFYEFSKAEFVISKILIEHDESGKGKITFQKKDFAAPETDPLQLSAVTLERLKTAWQNLNFLDSTENYQTVRDYSNLGTMKFSMSRDGRDRSATFNWTENKDAKTLADEYRKIGQQFVWIFDITVARENQPLEAPRLLDSLDAMVRRSEVSDAAQMIPLLKELSNDERLPLIARNHAAKLIEKIEKTEKK